MSGGGERMLLFVCYFALLSVSLANLGMADGRLEAMRSGVSTAAAMALMVLWAVRHHGETGDG